MVIKFINFCELNVPEDDKKCKFFWVISIDSLLAHENRYYLPVYLHSPAYKIIDKRIMIDCFGENPFETEENKFLINRSYKSCIMLELI